MDLLKKINRIFLVLMFTTILCVPTMPVFADSGTSSFVQPRDSDIAHDSFVDWEQFEKTYTLDEADGKYVNFYIENTGDVSIKITINGKNGRTIEPGDSGHITAEVKNGILGNSKKYTLKAVPTPNGGRISMDWRIAQRDEK